MGYADYLRNLLQPLGVYALAEDSFSGAELSALGAALDAVCAQIEEGQRESIPATAVSDGLAQYERLFGVLPESSTVAARRAAVAALLQVGGDSFSVDGISKSLAACGVTAKVAETDTAGTVVVSFPGTMGVPEGIERMQAIMELFLPCHLAVEYFYKYATWGEVAALTWGEAGKMTWLQLASYQAS